MRFAVESWAPEFGASTEGDLGTTSQEIDAGIEVPESAWAPRTPVTSTLPARILFVDGVRRVDARVWIDDARTAHPALCASIGAGAVCVEGGRASLLDARVVRGVFAHGVDLEAIETSCGTYDACPVAGTTPEALVIALQDRMAALEAEVTVAAGAGRDAAGADTAMGIDAAGVGAADTVVVVDGPLRGRGHVAGAVGYVKTQHTNYLVAPCDAVIGRLAAGQRTPLFSIGGPFPRMSWYLRLPGPVTHALAGVVRCEVDHDDDVGRVAQLADQVSALLPRFASAPHKDPRAPQNLYPIAGLERALRRRLGDPALLERSLRVAAARART
jgi:hypothetical protein